jgi:hypothetical protein
MVPVYLEAPSGRKIHITLVTREPRLVSIGAVGDKIVDGAGEVPFEPEVFELVDAGLLLWS